MNQPSIRAVSQQLEYLGAPPEQTTSPQTPDLNAPSPEHAQQFLQALINSAKQKSYPLKQFQESIQIPGCSTVLAIDFFTKENDFSIIIFDEEAEHLIAESSLQLKENPDQNFWDFRHRIVHSKFRGKGWGKFMIQMNEAFVKGLAQQTESATKITISLSQSTVLGLFLSQGYQPCTAGDQYFIDEYLRGENIVLATTFINQIKGIQSKVSDVFSSHREKDFMILRKLKNRPEGDFFVVRINLEKLIHP